MTTTAPALALAFLLAAGAAAADAPEEAPAPPTPSSTAPAPAPAPAVTEPVAPPASFTQPPAPAPAPAPPRPPRATSPAPSMRTRTLVLFLRAEGADFDRPRSRRTLDAHASWLQHLEINDRSLLAGIVEDDPRVHSAVVLPWSDEAGSRRFVTTAPGVLDGLLVPEVHPWLAEFDRVRVGAGIDDPREPYVLGFLVRGPGFMGGDSPELKALQSRHLAHLEEMAAARKLVLAGPLVDGGKLRGALLFQGVTADDARVLAEGDPAVRAGRFRVRVHEWSLPAQAVPWAP